MCEEKNAFREMNVEVVLAVAAAFLIKTHMPLLLSWLPFGQEIALGRKGTCEKRIYQQTT